ncbi:uncharacterized protein LOC141909419 isoform X2 [Tubulanus polymorphus]|uniref:uncharacterized protein LOC141909419 isoform X2 n=1 Tax=Tubulanus polymorphus TaxID=672921 RepID=UPI003DA2C3A0
MSATQSARQTSPDMLSKEEKEALLNKKMEEIRKKNEALKKRHEEVEADRRIAESVKGGSVQLAEIDSNSPTHRRTPSAKKEMKGVINEERKKAQTKSSGRGRQLDKMTKEPLKASEVTKRMNDSDKSDVSMRPKRPQMIPRNFNERDERHSPQKRFPSGGDQDQRSSTKQDHRASGDWDKRPQMRQTRDGESGVRRPRPVSGPPQHNRPPPSPNQEGGPPPDPVYNFLADRSRDNAFSNNSETETAATENDRDDKQQSANKSRRHPSNFGGANFDNVPKQINHDRQRGARRGGRGGPRSKMELTVRMTGRERQAYSEWKKEREQIDSSRIERQRNQEGDWRREWDLDKNEGSDDTKTEPAKRPVGSGRLPSPRGRGTSVPVTSNRGRGRGGAAVTGDNTSSRSRGFSSGSDDGRTIETKERKLFVKIDNDYAKKRSPPQRGGHGPISPRGGHSPISPRGGGAISPKKSGPRARAGSGRFASHRDQPVFDRSEILSASSPPGTASVRFAAENSYKEKTPEHEIDENADEKSEQAAMVKQPDTGKKSYHDDSFYNTDEEDLDIEQYRLKLDIDGNLITNSEPDTPDTPYSVMTTPVDHMKVLDWAADVEANLDVENADRENRARIENQDEDEDDDDDMYEDELVEEVYGDFDEETYEEEVEVDDEYVDERETDEPVDTVDGELTVECERDEETDLIDEKLEEIDDSVDENCLRDEVNDLPILEGGEGDENDLLEDGGQSGILEGSDDNLAGECESAVGAASVETDNSVEQSKIEDVSSSQSVEENIDINAAASAEYIPDDESSIDDKCGASSCQQGEAPVLTPCNEPGASSPEDEPEKLICDEASSVDETEPDSGASGDVDPASQQPTADSSISTDAETPSTPPGDDLQPCTDNSEASLDVEGSESPCDKPESIEVLSNEVQACGELSESTDGLCDQVVDTTAQHAPVDE